MRLSYSTLGLKPRERSVNTPSPSAGLGGESSEYFVTIANVAFVAHRVRYKDAPDICSLRLRREFATKSNHPPSTRFCITDAELADYKNAHTPKSKPSTSAHREDNEY